MTGSSFFGIHLTNGVTVPLSAVEVTDEMVTRGARALRDQGSIPLGAENFIHPQHRADARAVLEAALTRSA